MRVCCTERNCCTSRTSVNIWVGHTHTQKQVSFVGSKYIAEWGKSGKKKKKRKFEKGQVEDDPVLIIWFIKEIRDKVQCNPAWQVGSDKRKNLSNKFYLLKKMLTINRSKKKRHFHPVFTSPEWKKNSVSFLTNFGVLSNSRNEGWRDYSNSFWTKNPIFSLACM